MRGKFLFAGDRKFTIKGVTYGPFNPAVGGCEYGLPDTVNHDFALMAAHGFNAVRVYTVPPRWLLDLAARFGLRVLVGLPWEQHVLFLDDRPTQRRIERVVRDGVLQCADHPAVLAYAVGNEIPSSIVRWYGRKAIERFIARLCEIARAADPAGLVTYVNYPTTEYLQLPFLDFASYNVYLESRPKLAAYLARLQNHVGERPLVMAETGLDSRRNGAQAQADCLRWQIETLFAAGCTGAFMFAWTDEWFRGGHEIDDWAFGLTDRQRRPKPALGVVARAFREAPFPVRRPWPRVCVVVCTFNGARTIRRCLESLLQLNYPNYEVIVVNDGSTDDTAALVRAFPVRLISIENGGLSHARNVGLKAAGVALATGPCGEIVAYIDDDAWPDPDWLTHLAHPFLTTDHAGVGGPNFAPPGDGPIAECIANAPGGPNHVLIDDREAEHIPGCNMAFRRAALEAVGGFDTQFRIAGDDVDLCWRLQERGWTLGFSPAAMVWHHRRRSVRTYLKQQRNYGRAEAMLEVKWPQKYNSVGHVSWKGRVYGRGPTLPLSLSRGRIYHGVWGSGLFQSLYVQNPSVFRSLPLMPEWFLGVGALVVLTALGLIWQPLLLGLPMLLLALAAPIAQAILSAAHADVGREARGWTGRLGQRLLIAALHLLQPCTRLWGRLSYGLTPWRRHGGKRFALPHPRRNGLWEAQWASPHDRLLRLERALRAQEARTVRGGPYDRWDLEVRGGLFGRVRLCMAIEEHGSGAQMVRLQCWPRVASVAWALCSLFATLGALSAIRADWTPASLMAACVLVIAARAFGDCASATAAYLEAVVPTPDERASHNSSPPLGGEGRVRGFSDALEVRATTTADATVSGETAPDGAMTASTGVAAGADSADSPGMDAEATDKAA